MTDRLTTSGSDALVERVALALCAREADVRMLDSDGAAALWRQNRSRHLKEAHAAIAAIPPEGRVEELEGLLREVARWGELVMVLLEDEGPKVVPHLVDTDDNPGEYLREAVRAARTALQGDPVERAGDLYDAAFKARWFVDAVARGHEFTDIARANARDVAELLNTALQGDTPQGGGDE